MFTSCGCSCLDCSVRRKNDVNMKVNTERGVGFSIYILSAQIFIASEEQFELPKHCIKCSKWMLKHHCLIEHSKRILVLANFHLWKLKKVQEKFHLDQMIPPIITAYALPASERNAKTIQKKVQEESKSEKYLLRKNCAVRLTAVMSPVGTRTPI